MQIRILLLTFLLIFSVLNAQAQIGNPTYVNDTISGFDNGIPLHGTGDKVQWIYGPNSFKTNGPVGSPAVPGRIDTLFFRMGVVFTTYPVYSNLTVKLAQNVGTRDTWTNARWDTGMTTVYYEKRIVITAKQGDWLKIPLHSTFNYDPSLSLVVEMSVTGGTGCLLRQNSNLGKVRLLGSVSEQNPLIASAGQALMGMDITPFAYNDAGIHAFTGPENFCPGTHDIKVDLENTGHNIIDSVKLNWSVNGNIQIPAWYRSPIDTIRGSAKHIVPFSIGKDTFPLNVVKVIKIWTSNPNGVTDTVNHNDTIEVTLRSALNGTYTIGGVNPDFKSFSDAAYDLNHYGVCGPVTFIVDTGIYKEQLLLREVGGTSFTNTISFIGKDRDKTIIENTGTGILDWQTILLSGTYHVTLKHLTIRSKGSDYGIGVHLVNADNNLVDSCNIYLSDSSLAIKLFGVAGSGSEVFALAPGNSGDSNTFSNLNIHGGYQGIYFYGASSINHRYGNKFIRNTFTDYARYALNLSVLTNTQILSNRATSQRHADVEGFLLSAINDFVMDRNYIYTVRTGVDIYQVNQYNKTNSIPSLVTNNMVITTGSFPYTVWCRWPKHLRIHHNSFMNQTAGGVVFRCRAADSVDVKNNIITSTGKGSVILIWDNSKFYPDYKFDNNIYNSPGALYPVVSVESTSFKTFADWFTDDTSMNKNSYDQDPKFVSKSDLHIPTGSRVVGANLGVQYDYDGETRCALAPTIGADEVNGTIEADTTNPVLACIGESIQITFPPLLRFSNSDFGSTWGIKGLILRTKDGDTAKNYFLNNPVSGKDGYITYYPDSSEQGKSFYLNLIKYDYSGLGCEESFGKYIKVYKKPEAGFSLSSSRICKNEPVIVVLDTLDPEYKLYSFKMGDGRTVIKDSFPFYYFQTLSYNIELNVVAKNGCETNISKPIEVLPVPIVDFTFSKECYGDTMQFMDVVTPAGSVQSRQWDFGDGQGAVISNPMHTYDSSGIYNVTLVATDTNNCSNIKTRQVTVHPKPEAKFETDTGVCHGEVSQFNNLTKPSTGTYTWDFGDGSNSGNRSPSHKYDTAKRYHIVLIVRDSNECRDTVSDDVWVFIKPIASYTPEPDTVCAGDPIYFRNRSTTSGAMTYLWNFSDNDTSTEENPTFTYYKEAIYHSRLIIRDSITGCGDTTYGQVLVNEIRNVIFNIKHYSPSEKRFIPSDSAGLSFKWYFGDGDSSSDISPLHKYPNQTKAYEVKMVVSDRVGCSTGDTDSVFVISVGVNEVRSGHRVSVYPNPFSSIANVQLDLQKGEIVNIEVYDLVGKLVHVIASEHVSGTRNFTINADDLNPGSGIYMVKITIGDKAYVRQLIYTSP